jgi:hypothetical protein
MHVMVVRVHIAIDGSRVKASRDYDCQHCDREIPRRTKFWRVLKHQRIVGGRTIRPGNYCDRTCAVNSAIRSSV